MSNFKLARFEGKYCPETGHGDYVCKHDSTGEDNLDVRIRMMPLTNELSMMGMEYFLTEQEFFLLKFIAKSERECRDAVANRLYEKVRKVTKGKHSGMYAIKLDLLVPTSVIHTAGVAVQAYRRDHFGASIEVPKDRAQSNKAVAEQRLSEYTN